MNNFLEKIERNFDTISFERKKVLQSLAEFIQKKQNLEEDINLLYVCTHNSRRSHFGQIAALISSVYYGVEKVHVFSGGTEVTGFHPNAIKALKKISFEITSDNGIENPIYRIDFGGVQSIWCFSKVYNHEQNPKSNFVAIMTCSDAETNCPFIPGEELRIATTYADPKIADGTSKQDQTYSDRFTQIATETLYVFSLIKK